MYFPDPCTLCICFFFSLFLALSVSLLLLPPPPMYYCMTTQQIYSLFGVSCAFHIFCSTVSLQCGGSPDALLSTVEFRFVSLHHKLQSVCRIQICVHMFVCINLQDVLYIALSRSYLVRKRFVVLSCL
jgi:hypothetical protein